MSAATHSDPPIVDLSGPDRDRAIDALKQSFTGIYRWHAKRTLRAIASVRAIEVGGAVVAVAMTERFDREVAYVYYLFVATAHRERGLASRLLDDALARFRQGGAVVAYAACEEENAPSLRLFGSRGFRRVDRGEPGFREGGLGAWGYRSRMRIVPGEVLLGLRLSDPPPPVRGREVAKGIRGP
ncbi:MAG TPA: GNAT family N-acetyltransferase [Thermoplasmata archaeon]|nr:GNAT family N-acetyltransferase [Thermoplasmata archaeon]